MFWSKSTKLFWNHTWLKRNIRLLFNDAEGKRSTIFALSSGQGKCGVAVIRVSGPAAGEALKRLTNSDYLPKPRMALLRHISNPVNGEALDKGLVLWFPGPKSFTGEDCCEFQVHGGVAVINSIMNSLQLIGLRPANPGEFTKRAFFNGKLDLTEIEGLADLLAAETELQRKQAFLQTEGFLSNLYNDWSKALLNNLAHLEAHIDFDETETLKNDIIQNVSRDVIRTAEKIEKHLIDGRKGECLRNGVKAIIMGEPNVGKSSLFNALCQKPAAIVTPIEGTTRDILEVKIDINGYPLILTDTAGLRMQTCDIVEQEGIQRAFQSYENADLVLLLIDGINFLNSSKSFSNYLEMYSKAINIDIKTIINKNALLIINKIDLVGSNNIFNKGTIPISCKTEEGFPLLIEKITERLKVLCGEPNREHPSMNQIRHRKNITDCLNSLKRFVNRIQSEANVDVVLLAEDLRQAVQHLGKLTGSVTNEQVLDIIFKDFCIGK